MRGADVVVELLIQSGVTCIFGVPGDTSMAFHDALRARQGEIRYIICRDERHAAYAADAYARVSGRLGVVDVPSGGGALYVVPGLSEANLSNIPLLCLASEITMTSDEMTALTDCNQVDLFAAVCKWNAKAQMVDKLPHLVRKAIRNATSGVRGACALTLPENILRAEFKGPQSDIRIPPQEGALAPLDARPAGRDVAAVHALLRQAKRPVVLAGGGVHLAQAWDALARFATLYHMPVVTSIDGKGSVAETEPYALGTIGANGGSREANEVVSKADLILILGCKLDNVTTMGKKIIAPDAAVVQVDLNPDMLGNALEVSCPVHGDILGLLSALADLPGGADGQAERLAEWTAFTAQKRQEKLDRVAKDYTRDSVGVSAARVFEALERRAPAGAIFVGDAGTPTPYIAAYLKLPQAGKRTVIPRAHGALGYALPAAIGAKVGRPEAAVVGMFGDGSFGMALGELETASRLGLGIVYINFQNNCYGWIKNIQRLYYDAQYFGVDFGLIDAVKAADSMGIPGRHITENAQIDEAIAWAFAQKGPVMLNVVLENPADYVPPVNQWEIDNALPSGQRKKLVY